MATWQGSRVPAPTRTAARDFLAGEAGELAGVSGTTLGQWARRGLIRSSVSDAEPRLYASRTSPRPRSSAPLLERGVRHADVHRLVERLNGSARGR